MRGSWSGWTGQDVDDMDDMDDVEEQVSDADLIERLRQGDRDATVELWTRHYPAVLLAAKRVTRQPRDAEEIASDAFSGMLSATASGAGPTTSVRAYLVTSVRNLAASRARRSSASEVITDDIAVFDRPTRDTTAHMSELELVRVAFAALPRRWQIVLWRTAVDRDTNIDVGQAMDLSPNGVAALAKRARRGFRLSYLRAHLSDRGVSAACEPFIDGLADLTVPEASTASGVVAHVATCSKCEGRLEELKTVDANFAGLLGPAIFALVPAKILTGAAGASTSTLSGASSPATGHAHVLSRLGTKWALGSAGAVAVTSVAVAVAMGTVRGPQVTPPAADSVTSLRPSVTPSVALTASATSPVAEPSGNPEPSAPTPTPTTSTSPQPTAPAPTRTVAPVPSSTPSSPQSGTTTSPASVTTSPLTAHLAVRGPRTDISIDVSASVEGTTGPMRLTLEIPDGVTLTGVSGHWRSCSQGGGTITCTGNSQTPGTWAGTLRTVWAPDSQGTVRAVVRGTYANGSPAVGSVETIWPP